MNSLKDRLVVQAYKAASVVLNAMPSSMAGFAADLAGPAMTPFMGERRMMVRRHLRRVVGPSVTETELSRLVSQAFASYAHYWVESFRLPYLSDAELAERMDSEGMEHIHIALEAGKGAILALPHLGSWEFGGRWLGTLGMPLTVVVEPLHPPELFEWFVSYRRSVGMNVVALGPSAGAEVLKTLRDNRMAALLCDRDLVGNGIEVEFFGERTTLPAGPATLAMRAGAALLPCAVYHRPDGRHQAVVSSPIDTSRQGGLRADISRVTQDLAGCLEEIIRRQPEQWHLLQPNWPSDRP
ncbi:MAG: phosphatidylinositol mannoside acyltransferase [Acidimicrobiales bacterium]